MERTPLIDRLWAEGILDDERQQALEVLVDGPTQGLPPCLAVTFDPDAYALTVAPLFWPVPPRTIALPRPAGSPILGDAFGQPQIALFGPDLQKVGDFKLDDTVGVLVVAFQVYRYAADFRRSPFLAWGRSALSPRAAVRAQQGYGPVDLIVNRAGDAALVLDRAMGQLHHVDLGVGEVKGTYPIRSVGGTSALNAAWIGSRVFLTDGQTAGVTILDLATGKMGKEPTELGVVGNLLPAPDNSSLYLLSVHPEFAVRVVDVDSFEPIRQLPIKGAPFSRLGDPTDVFAISPDAQHMLVLAYVDDPQPRTPVVNVFEVQTGKNIQRYRLNPTRKPTALAFGVENPVYVAPITVEDALIQLGYITAEDLAAVQRRMTEPETLVIEPTLTPMGPAGDSLQSLAGSAGAPAKQREAAPYKGYASDADELILEFLHKQFQDRAKMDIRSRRGAWDRLQEAAARVRGELEWFSASEVHLEDVAEGYDLHSFITREQLDGWLHVAEREEILKGVVIDAVVPEFCPECRTPMLGAMTCRACGWSVGALAMSNPKKLSRASINPLAYLPPGHVLLADPERQRVVELDRKGAIIWQVQADTLHAELRDLLKWPLDALRVANGNTLILDMLTCRVFEITKGGRPAWEWPQDVASLAEPLRVRRSEWGDTYVADRRNHRIWRVSAHGDPLEGYGSGSPGIGMGELSGPTDVQVMSDGSLLITDSGNHRVIEVTDGEVVWQYGNADLLGGGAGAGAGPGQLDGPRRAMRLETGETMILDTGNRRVIVVDRAGAIVWEHDTFQRDAGIPCDRPLGFLRLPEGRLIYWDLQQLVEINLRHDVIWHTMLDRLDTNPRLKREVPEPETVERDQPRRLFQIARLTDDDPEMQALQAAALERRKQSAAARQAWEAGDVDAYATLLKKAAEQRQAAAAEAPKAIRAANVEAVRERLRREAQNRQAADQPAAAPPSAPAAAVPAAESALPATTAPATEPAGVVTADAIPAAPAPAPESADVESPPADEADSDADAAWPNATVRPGLAASLAPAGAGIVGHATAAMTHAGTAQETAPLPSGASAPVPSDVIPAATPAAMAVPAAAPAEAPPVRPEPMRPEPVRPHAERHTPLDEMGMDRPPLDILSVQRARGQISLFGRDRTVRWTWGEGVLERPQGAELTPYGNVLVADTYHHRVLEVETITDEVIWTCGDGSLLSFPRAAKRLENGNTLIADAGNRRVVEVSPDGEIVWQWGSWSQLNTPAHVDRLENGNTLITDWGSHVILKVTPQGEIVWTFGEPRRSGAAANLLHYPEQATWLPNGNVLIVDGRNNRVLEVDTVGQVQWQFSGEGFHRLTGPTWAERQADGATVILHGAGRAALEVSGDGRVLWRALLPVAQGG
jgi:uncharacterized protein (UPF0248 family)